MSHDLVTKGQCNRNRGRESKGANKRPQCINWAKRREGDKLAKVNKGRGTDPDHKWAKIKRQTFSNTTLYFHVKFHTDSISGTMCSL